MADPKFNSFHYQMAFSLYGLMTLIAAVLNVLAICKIISRKQNSAVFNANEKNLLFVSLVTFGTQIIRIIYVIATNLFGSNKEILGFLIIVSPYAIDIFGCSGSITIMLLSKTTREAYATFYKLKRKKFTSISMIGTLTNP
uniref:Serpentine receptor class gamma n=1 Tax=Panagrolaimus davidi TaxID=227884 RepID=A0A914R0A5_9BILA